MVVNNSSIGHYSIQNHTNKARNELVIMTTVFIEDYTATEIESGVQDLMGIVPNLQQLISYIINVT